jgi:hypothetical protein
MKAITIIISIMALAWQISSTFAQDIIMAANPDFATTPDGRKVNINVIANDIFGTSNGFKVFFRSITELTQPVIMLGMGNGVIDAGRVTLGAAIGTVDYFPVPGFVGKITFEYTISISTRRGLRDRRLNFGSTLTGIVTVTVLARQIRPVFRIGNQFSTESALATVNLSNLAPSFNISEAIRLAAGGGV